MRDTLIPSVKYLSASAILHFWIYSPRVIPVCFLKLVIRVVLPTPNVLAISSAFVSALVIDYVFLGSGKAFVANIVSDKSDEISRAVIERLGRTTTILDAVGGYTGKPKKVIIVSFTIRQYRELMNIVNQADKLAFVSISRAHEINGEGFTR